jgi:hypothetical protein
MASGYSLQQAEKCRVEAARARDEDIRAYWKEAERSWLALAQHGEALLWPFVSRQSDHVTVLAQDGDIIVSVSGFCAVYYKPANQPQLSLRRRSETDDNELLARLASRQRQGARAGVDCLASRSPGEGCRGFKERAISLKTGRVRGIGAVRIGLSECSTQNGQTSSFGTRNPAAQFARRPEAGEELPAESGSRML